MNPIRSVGIILDGNRRWARGRGVSTLEGHRAGLENIKKLSSELPRLNHEYGLSHVTLYAFSTENWNRTTEEVSYLMTLFEYGFKNLVDYLSRGDTASALRIRIVGERHRFSKNIQRLMKEAEERTKHNKGVTVVFALSYGGRTEIVEAVNRALRWGKPVTESTFRMHLWTAEMPDPDIIIRTGGEQRLSNFLTWSSVYSELFFTSTYWPDFSIEELERIFSEYYERERRHGK